MREKSQGWMNLGGARRHTLRLEVARKRVSLDGAKRVERLLSVRCAGLNIGLDPAVSYGQEHYPEVSRRRSGGAGQGTVAL